MAEIKYVGFYDTPANTEENRNYVPSCATKMEYVMSAIHSCGYDVRVVSASATNNRAKYKAQNIVLQDGITLQLFKTYPFGNKLQRIRSVLSIKWNLLCELLFRTKSTDTVMVYHSLSYMSVVALAHKLRRFRLIVEAEEIYADVIQNLKIRSKELQFFERADAFVFPTVLLNEVVNVHNKPYVVVHGTYKAEPDRGERFDDDKIHCVYAGTFDPRKGGAAAATAAAFLDEKYHIHILGFGSEKDKKRLLSVIESVSHKSKCTVTFDGLKKGEEYIRFIQKCHIGLSTQTPDAEYNATSFPSKVLTYMANGLCVVSVCIKALETSAVDKLLYYYDAATPESIAEAIRSVDISCQSDSREFISYLDKMFCNNLKEMLGE